MRKHVPKSNGVVERVVVEPDRRNRLANGPLPGELAFFDQKPGSDRSEQLGVRSDRVQRVRCYRQFLFVVAVAVALGEGELVVDDDPYADADAVPVLERLFHERIKVAEFGRYIRARAVILGS